MSSPPRFIFDPNFPRDVECGVCLSPWVDPVELRPCCHIFCQRCLPPPAGGRVCSVCGLLEQSRRQPDRFLSNIALSLAGKCSVCEWRGVCGQFSAHVSTCSGGAFATPTGAAASSPAAAAIEANESPPSESTPSSTSAEVEKYVGRAVANDFVASVQESCDKNAPPSPPPDGATSPTKATVPPPPTCPPPPPVALPASVWEWEGDGGHYVPYVDMDATLLEAAFSGNGGTGVHSLHYNGTLYTVDFSAMTQRNPESGRVRRIRRTTSAAASRFSLAPQQPSAAATTVTVVGKPTTNVSCLPESFGLPWPVDDDAQVLACVLKSPDSWPSRVYLPLFAPLTSTTVETVVGALCPELVAKGGSQSPNDVRRSFVTIVAPFGAVQEFRVPFASRGMTPRTVIYVVSPRLSNSGPKVFFDALMSVLQVRSSIDSALWLLDCGVQLPYNVAISLAGWRSRLEEARAAGYVSHIPAILADTNAALQFLQDAVDRRQSSAVSAAAADDSGDGAATPVVDGVAPWTALHVPQRVYDRLLAAFATLDVASRGVLWTTQTYHLCKWMNVPSNEESIDDLLRPCPDGLTFDRALRWICERVRQSHEIYRLPPSRYLDALEQYHTLDTDVSGGLTGTEGYHFLRRFAAKTEHEAVSLVDTIFSRLRELVDGKGKPKQAGTVQISALAWAEKNGHEIPLDVFLRVLQAPTKAGGAKSATGGVLTAAPPPPPSTGPKKSGSSGGHAKQQPPATGIANQSAQHDGKQPLANSSSGSQGKPEAETKRKKKPDCCIA